MNREEELFQKRLLDLSNLAYQRGIVVFSDFLNLNELNIFHMSRSKFSCREAELFGGSEFAERQMAAFIPDALYRSWNYPIACIKIIPLQKKFAETLTHRDYLGAILNVGIERSKIGDIFLQEEATYLYCCASMSDFICSNLIRIKHTSIRCEEIDAETLKPSIELKKKTGTIASERLDAMIALAFQSSRSKFISLIEGKKVFVNGKLITSNAYLVKEGDIVSVRGYGRFLYEGLLSNTKKGRYFVSLGLYQ